MSEETGWENQGKGRLRRRGEEEAGEVLLKSKMRSSRHLRHVYATSCIEAYAMALSSCRNLSPL